MFNTQQYITTELEKILCEILPLTSKRMKNLVYIIIGIILSKSVKASDISQKLKDGFTDATKDSKIKRIYRFFIEEVLRRYVERSENNKITIIFDYTTIDTRLLILKFSLKVGKRSIPLWYKIFEYDEDGGRDFSHVEEGLRELKEIFKPYNYEVRI